MDQGGGGGGEEGVEDTHAPRGLAKGQEVPEAGWLDSGGKR